MTRWRASLRTALLAVTATAALTAPAAPAPASPMQESWFQDDNQLIFNTPTGADRVLGQLAALGVNRVRVSLFWATVAPQSNSRHRPSFDASDPAAYPLAAWDRYDQIVALAQKHGLGIEFNITSPAPLWASAPALRPDIANIWDPSASEFRQFATAVGRRYSGAYIPPAPPPPPTPSGGGAAPAHSCQLVDQLLNHCPPAPPALAAHARAASAAAPVPRVDHWSIWNEPDQPGWLDPQWTLTNGHGWVETSPRLYRGLLDAAYAGLAGTGHGSDTILIGETAPGGLDVRGTTRAIKALHFLRQLYCLDDRYHPLRGSAATVRGCPAAAHARAGFAAAHPVLFAASGYAHHPYQLRQPPGYVPHDPDYATISSLPRLSHALSRVFAAYGRHRPGGLPLYLSEFGYNTRPPNPVGVTPAQQAAYIDQAQYIAYSDASVRALSQFLLVDDAPRPGRNGVRYGYGATFQTGLEFLGGLAKPALAAYELPVYLPSPIDRRHRLRVWGQVRPAGAGARVAIQFSRSHRGPFRSLVVAAASRARGYLDVRVRVPGPGRLRLAWTQPGGRVVFSRVVAARRR